MATGLRERRTWGVLVLLLLIPTARMEGQCHVEKLVASDVAASQLFGGAIAFDGQRALVGSRSAAYVFERRKGLWSEGQRLPFADAFRLAIDGNTVVIARSGQPLVDVFERQAGTWVHAEVLATGVRPHAVALTCEIEGDRALVAVQSSGDGFGEPGRAYLFERSGRRWGLAARLKPDVSERGDLLGESMAIVGGRILLGAPGYCEATLSGAGAFVFELQGGIWQQSANLIHDAFPPIESFGGAVGFAGDRILVSDPRWCGVAPGLLYLFEPSPSGWSLADTFNLGSTPREYGFGTAIAARGDVAFVGHPRDEDVARDAGAVYVLSFACPPPVRAR